MHAGIPPTIRPLRESDPAWIASAFAAIGWRKPRELYERYLAEQEAGQRPSVGIAVGLGPEYGPAQRLYVERGYVPDGRSVAYNCGAVRYEERVVVDDDLALCFTRTRRG